MHCFRGFLVAMGTYEDNCIIANYIYCSERGNCNSCYLFSKYQSLCAACGRVINVDDIITVNAVSKDKKVWCHYDCAQVFVRPETSNFQVCQRCMLHIMNFEESEPSRLGAIDGFKHKSCPSSNSPRPFKRRVENISSEVDLHLEPQDKIIRSSYDEDASLYKASHVPKDIHE